MRRVIAITIVLLFLSLPIFTWGDVDNTILQKQKELQKKREQINNIKMQVKNLEKKELNIVQEISKIDMDLDKAEKDLSIAETRLREAQAKLVVLSTQLSIMQRNLRYRSLNYKESLGDIFKTIQPKTYLDIIFTQDVFASIAVPYYLKTLMKKEVNRLQSIDKQCKDIDRKKKEWEDEKRKIELLVKDISERKEYIEAKKREREAFLKKIREQKRYQQQVIATLERESKEIENLIKRLASSKIQKAKKGDLSWPVIGSVTSGFGMRRHPILGGAPLFHTGVDISASYGTPIRAAASGRVIFAGWYGGYGNMIIIDHGGNISTVYGHLSRIAVRSGEEVSEGDIIGYVGSTGLSTGPHLHFEVRVNGKPVDPMNWLK